MNKKIKYGLLQSIMSLGMVLLFSTTAWAAGGIADSKYVTGTLKLLNDIATGLTKLAAAATVVAVIAYGLYKIFADDMENKMWNKRLVRAIIGCVIVLGASALVALFTGYYS